jgi:hypothetical protein
MSERAQPPPWGTHYHVREQRFTRRQFLIYHAVMEGADMFTAMEAVSSTAIEHPEWDMEEEMTWEQWRKLGG